jgi:hypothetical protein
MQALGHAFDCFHPTSYRVVYMGQYYITVKISGFKGISIAVAKRSAE